MKSFERLLNIMDELKKSVHGIKSELCKARYLTIEELYELSDAIIENDMHKLKRNLEIFLLHVVFYSKIASEEKSFNIEDVINSICLG